MGDAEASKTEIEHHYFETLNGALGFIGDIASTECLVKFEVTAVGGWEVKLWIRKDEI